MKAKFKRLDKQVQIPVPAHIGDGAVDLQCRVDFSLEPGERAAIPTGLAIAIPDGYAGLVIPRSGHALRHGLSVVNGPGLIDSGYRGEVHVILVNLGQESVSFRAGDRIAQLAIIAVPEITWEETDELDDTSRGEGGFGSTGK